MIMGQAYRHKSQYHRLCKYVPAELYTSAFSRASRSPTSKHKAVIEPNTRRVLVQDITRCEFRVLLSLVRSSHIAHSVASEEGSL